MTLRNSVPVAWRPRGLTDSIETSGSAQGSMAFLQNLIPLSTTPDIWQCRPASVLLVDMGDNTSSGPFSSGFSSGFQHSFFPGNGTVGQISCFKVIGDIVYGLVGGPSGFDYPFAYNILTDSLVTVTNFLDTTKMPTTQPQTAAWNPPSMDLVGTDLLVTHPGFLGGGSNLYFGWFDLSSPTAPVWNAGNLTGSVTFLFPPTWVGAFNGRAYWLSNPPTGNPAAVFSDILLPRQVTNATQVITFDDQVRLTATAPLPLNNQLGGIVQALMVFKGSTQTYQITGDPATNNLAKNALNIATGTDSPSSLAVTAKGIAFAAPDGVRIIDFNAQVSDPLGWEGQGKVLPFLYSGTPTRCVAAATGSYYRVTVQDTTQLNSPYVEYWLDTIRGQWSGPHTFPANWVDGYKNSFIVSARGVPAKLWRSDVQQSPSSTFVENGTQLQFVSTTSLLPDTDQMQENSMIETTLYMAMEANIPYPVSAYGADGSVFDSVPIQLSTTVPLWGSAVWGQFTWGGQAGVLFPRQIPWTVPVVFRRMQLSISGPSSASVKLGMWHCRYQQLGYLQQSLVA